MNEDAYDVVANYANAKELKIVKEQYRKAGKVDMCKAIKEMIEDGKSEGKNEGRIEGRNEGRIEGIIRTARRYHASDSEIIEQLMEELAMDEKQARECLERVK